MSWTSDTSLLLINSRRVWTIKALASRTVLQLCRDGQTLRVLRAFARFIQSPCAQVLHQLERLYGFIDFDGTHILLISKFLSYYRLPWLHILKGVVCRDLKHTRCHPKSIDHLNIRALMNNTSGNLWTGWAVQEKDLREAYSESDKTLYHNILRRVLKQSIYGAVTTSVGRRFKIYSTLTANDYWPMGLNTRGLLIVNECLDRSQDTQKMKNSSGREGRSPCSILHRSENSLSLQKHTA